MSKFSNLKQTCGDSVVVVASKYMDVDEMHKLYLDGARHFGENRTHELLAKKALLPNDIVWHFIGHLQTNKTKAIINEIDYLHSLDRPSLALAIQRYRKEPLKCFIQVNLTNQPHKSGIQKENLKDFMQSLSKYDKIQVIGLMTIGVMDDAIKTEAIFKTLYELRDGLKLSMGMSDDYLIALKYQTDFVRIGSKLKE